MRTMKDSGIEWIGQIPQEWDVCKIKNCFNVFAGATPKSGNSEFWDGDIVWVTPADYTTEQKYISKGRKNITREGFESCSTEMIPTGSLIFSKRAPIGLAAINTVELCTNQGCLSCVPLDENDVEYFYYAFGCFSEQFDLYGSGTTFKEISADAFVNFSIPCPVPETQRKISEYLRNRCAEIDALIAAKVKTNALLKERRQSIIYEAVTKGLNLNAPMKDSGIEWIGQIPQDWQIAKVKHVYSFQTGWTPSTSNAAYFDGDLPWANISDIGKTKTIYDTAKHITEEAVANSSMGISPKGSLMYSFKLSVGDVSFCGTDMYTNEAIATFLPSDKYDLRYLYYAAPLFIIKNANENIYGAKLLNQELIRNALILNPPYNEQVSVADYLDAKCAEIDALISANEATIKKLKEYRQSIIYEAVTGKIEI